VVQGIFQVASVPFLDATAELSANAVLHDPRAHISTYKNVTHAALARLAQETVVAASHYIAAEPRLDALAAAIASDPGMDQELDKILAGLGDEFDTALADAAGVISGANQLRRLLAADLQNVRARAGALAASAGSRNEAERIIGLFHDAATNASDTITRVVTFASQVQILSANIKEVIADIATTERARVGIVVKAFLNKTRLAVADIQKQASVGA
jgi:hypothetical protein